MCVDGEKASQPKPQDLEQVIDSLTPQTFSEGQFYQLLEELNKRSDSSDLTVKLLNKFSEYNDYNAEQGRKKVVEQDQKEREEYLAFYRGELFEGPFMSQDQTVATQLNELREARRAGSLDESAFLKACSELSSLEVSESYWAKHSTEYTERIDRLTTQVSAEKKQLLDQSKLVVVIAAMNENELELALQALQENYGTAEAFQAEVAVMIYHNHREKPDAIDPEVKRSVETVSAMKNVICIDEQVGKDVGIQSDVAKAKKVAADSTMRLLGAQNKPLLFIDGDLRKINPPGTLLDVTSQLSVEQGTVAVSTTYCHDSRIDELYPSLAQYFSLNESLILQWRNYSQEQPYTVGGFTMIDSTMFMAAGGWPISKPEDVHFTYKLRYIFDELQVVKSVFPEVRVEMDNGREIASILEKKSAFHRWAGKNHREYSELSGSKRLDWAHLPADLVGEIPLLAEHDPQQSLLTAINTNYLEFVESLKQNGSQDPAKVRLRLQLRTQFILNFLQQSGVEKLIVEVLDTDPKDISQLAQTVEIDLTKPGESEEVVKKFTVSSFKELVLPTNDT